LLFGRHIAQLGLSFAQRIGDAGQHAIEIPEDIIIPESDDSKSMGFEPRSPCSIFIGLLLMLTAIHFHHQSMPQAAEIDDVITDSMLTAELRAIESLGAEILPEETFCRSLFLAEATDIITQLFWCAHNRKSYRRV